ncbi:MAG: phage virion morphogenesis protein [Pseudomonadales bacterium]|jgi:phage virion morphogenesis protein|nr:phage virion morphogenesis protein [Pseudomonadales bacterium]
MSYDLYRLEHWAAPLLQKLSPAERRRLTLAIARELLAAQRRSMTVQAAPDGAPWQPRKPPLREARGKIKRKAQAAKARQPMMRGLRRAKWLKARATPEQAVVEFVGRAERIARLHHHGGPDRVEPGEPVYDYPARPLIGITPEMAERVLALIVEHLARDR